MRHSTRAKEKSSLHLASKHSWPRSMDLNCFQTKAELPSCLSGLCWLWCLPMLPWMWRFISSSRTWSLLTRWRTSTSESIGTTSSKDSPRRCMLRMTHWTTRQRMSNCKCKTSMISFRGASTAMSHGSRRTHSTCGMTDCSTGCSKASVSWRTMVSKPWTDTYRKRVSMYACGHIWKQTKVRI